MHNIFAVLILLIPLNACNGGSSDNQLFDSAAEPEAADACFMPDDEVTVNSTNLNVEFVTTPDACFTKLDGFDYAPNYLEVDGLRMHYVDEGPIDGELVLMLHGQPSWSYLYRKMIPVLVDAGYRVIALDHIGMGRSDKPTDPHVHQYEQHVLWLKEFINQLELTDITLFVQDWGSLIGLRVAGDMTTRFARIVVANGDMPIIPTGANPFVVPAFEVDESLGGFAEFQASRSGNRIESFQQWIDYAAGVPQLIAGDVVEFATNTSLSTTEHDSYDAPFPSLIYRAAIRSFPAMVAGIEEQNTYAWENLGRYEKPFLFLAGEQDPNLGSVQNQNKWVAHVPGAAGQDHRRYEASHFIQEDVGAAMAEQVVEFMQANPLLEEPVAGFLYDFRYCEVLLTSFESGQIRADVYNSVGLSVCPQEQWEALDALAIADEFGVDRALLNGPRFWVLDTIVNNGAGTRSSTRSFGGIDMRLAASVLLPADVVTGGAAYQVSRVSRDTVWKYVAGRQVYELQDPDGGRYIMQSFSRIVDSDLQLSELASLAERLELPEGWSFSTRILVNPFDLPTVGGVAEVVTDNLSNTYQRIP